MKFYISAFLLLLSATANASTLILDSELDSNWEVYSPVGIGEIVVDDKCRETTGESLFANLDYATGINIQCTGDDCGIVPPFYGGDDRYIVFDAVFLSDKGDCPRHGDPSQCMLSNFGVQFYDAEDKFFKSQPRFISLMDEGEGVVSSSNGKHSVCMKIPPSCQNMGPSFTGWTGIAFVNLPLAKFQCQGPIDVHIDYIELMEECPFEEASTMNCAVPLKKNGRRRLKKGSTKSAKGTKKAKGGKKEKDVSAGGNMDKEGFGVNVNGGELADDDYDRSFCIDRGESDRKLEDDGMEYRGVCKED